MKESAGTTQPERTPQTATGQDGRSHAHAGLFFHPLRFNSSITPKSRQALPVHFNKHHSNEQKPRNESGFDGSMPWPVTVGKKEKQSLFFHL
jgi:hypothetical protein